MTKEKTTEEINRIIRCADFRHERFLRPEATRFVDELKLSRAILGAPYELSSAGQEHGLLGLYNALDALILMRADVDCFDAPLRRPILDNLEDAEDGLRELIHGIEKGPIK